MWLLLISLFGLVVPNGLFIHWLFTSYSGIGPVLNNQLALGFILDAFMATAILAVYFARTPIGRIKWYWFVVFSIVGGLGFSLPFYWWVNKRQPAT